MPHRSSEKPTPAVSPSIIELIRTERAPNGPADCVRQFPTLNPLTVELVAFDWEGCPRFRSEVPTNEDLESWEILLLRRCRKFFPAPRPDLHLID